MLSVRQSRLLCHLVAALVRAASRQGAARLSLADAATALTGSDGYQAAVGLSLRVYCAAALQRGSLEVRKNTLTSVL